MVKPNGKPSSKAIKVMCKGKPLEEIIDETEWTTSTAKQYEKAPHQYIKRTDYPVLCAVLERLIDEDGYDAYFYRAKFRYLDIGEYMYWHYDLIFNRALKSEGIVKKKPTEKAPVNHKIGEY